VTVEALWSVEIERDRGWAPAGVVILKTGRILGGDSTFYYLGSFAEKDSTIRGTALINYYYGNAVTLWGDTATKFMLDMKGTISGNTITGTVRRDDTGQTKKIRFTKHADLP